MSDKRKQNGQQDMRDSDFRPRALAEMALAIRNDSDQDSGLSDTVDLISLGGGLEALDSVIAALDQGQPFDPRPGKEAQQMAFVMAALTEDMERSKLKAAEQAEATETPADKVPELTN